MSRYDVPPKFLEEQDREVVCGYAEKLVAIGINRDELAINREAALGSAGNAVDFLPTEKKRRLFERVRPLTDQGIEISEMDRFSAGSQGPLNRFKVSIGSATNVRAAAARLLGLLATEPDECSSVLEVALAWVRSDDPGLQQMGASLLTLPKLPSHDVRIAELATHHNPWVRRVALGLPGVRASPEVTTLERLASDPYIQVRLSIVYALSAIRTSEPDSYDRIRASLNADPSALVRAIAAESLGPTG